MNQDPGSGGGWSGGTGNSAGKGEGLEARALCPGEAGGPGRQECSAPVQAAARGQRKERTQPRLDRKSQPDRSWQRPGCLELRPT